MKNVLITGATGFLGGYLLNRLLDDKNIRPIVLVRGKKGQDVSERISGTLKYFYGNDGYKGALKRIIIAEGAIDAQSLGLKPEMRSFLLKELDEIYHSAAIAEFRIPLDIIRKSNVDGARNVFEFAMECKRSGRLKKVNHVSTAFLAGTKTGTFYEDELNVKQEFHNTYEQTKFEAELLAKDYIRRGLDMAIFRPSILTGDYNTGRTSNFKMLYQPLHFFARELFDVVPVDGCTKANLIAVDAVADMIYAIANEKAAAEKTYHISNLTTVEVGHFFDVASDFFGFKKPEFIPADKFDIKTLTPVQRNLIGPYVPYFNYKLQFDCESAQVILEKKGFIYKPIDDDCLIRLFKFCHESGCIKTKRHYVTAG